VDQEAQAQDREDDEAERQIQDREPVAQQAFLGNPPAVEEQQRRQEQQEEDVRLQFDAAVEDTGDQGAEAICTKGSGTATGKARTTRPLRMTATNMARTMPMTSKTSPFDC
jgi:hypothetical protein